MMLETIKQNIQREKGGGLHDDDNNNNNNNLPVDPFRRWAEEWDGCRQRRHVHVMSRPAGVCVIRVENKEQIK